MDDFTLEIYPTRDLMPGACRICDMVGARAPVTHCVEVNGLDATYSCADHIRHALNDALGAVEHPWRVYVEPSDRVHSRDTHVMAHGIIALAADIRSGRISRKVAADQVKSIAVQSHEAARFLEHYENMNGGNEDE